MIDLNNDGSNDNQRIEFQTERVFRRVPINPSRRPPEESLQSGMVKHLYLPSTVRDLLADGLMWLTAWGNIFGLAAILPTPFQIAIVVLVQMYLFSLLCVIYYVDRLRVVTVYRFILICLAFVLITL